MSQLVKEYAMEFALGLGIAVITAWGLTEGVMYFYKTNHKVKDFINKVL
jgi:long-subunit acyl-CoA synthetase (AMP-forming)